MRRQHRTATFVHHSPTTTPRSPQTKLVVCLSIANLLSSAAYSLSFVNTLRHIDGGFGDSIGPLCKSQAVFIITFETSSVLWTVAIAWTLYEQVVLKAGSRVERWEPWYHACCWGAPVVLAIVLLLTDEVGPADSHAEWCWIAGLSPTSRWVQIGVFYIPLVVAFVVSAVVYVRVGRAFGELSRTGAVDAGKERMVQLRLRLYLLVFVVVWTVPLVHRTQELFSSKSPEWLQILHAATGGRVMGLLNSLVYGCNDKTLRPYRSAALQLRQRLTSASAVPRVMVDDAMASRATPREALLGVAANIDPPTAQPALAFSEPQQGVGGEGVDRRADVTASRPREADGGGGGAPPHRG